MSNAMGIMPAVNHTLVTNNELPVPVIKSLIKSKFRHTVEFENLMDEEIKDRRWMCSLLEHVHCFGQGDLMETATRNWFKLHFDPLDAKINSLLISLLSAATRRGCSDLDDSVPSKPV